VIVIFDVPTNNSMNNLYTVNESIK